MCSTPSGIKGLGITKVLYEFHYKKEPSILNTFAFSNYLLHSSHAAFATFAMTSSRTALFAPESETKTEIARCRPLGSVTSPISLVAAVTPSTVRDVPVLCATTVPLGNNPSGGDNEAKEVAPSAF